MMSIEEYLQKKEEKSRETLIDCYVDIAIYLILLLTVFFREIVFLNICLKIDCLTSIYRINTI